MEVGKGSPSAIDGEGFAIAARVDWPRAGIDVVCAGLQACTVPLPEMEQLPALPVPAGSPVRLLQITDLHHFGRALRLSPFLPVPTTSRGAPGAPCSRG